MNNKSWELNLFNLLKQNKVEIFTKTVNNFSKAGLM